MTGGFAFVAYPAEYQSSGVMTFIVGADGVVYQKDLGKKTEVLAKGMKSTTPIPLGKRLKSRRRPLPNRKPVERNSGDDLLTTPSERRSSVCR